MERLWWLCGICIVVLCMEHTWAQLYLPMDRLAEAIYRYGMLEQLFCENTECLATWKAYDLEGFDTDICTLHAKKKRVLCRYVYDVY